MYEVLGHGGMGTVYRARQEFFDREVALKVVQPQLSSDPAFTARFRSEMKHAALIDHPNVVPVYAAGESNGSLYIAMKLIRGENLANRLARGGHLPPDQAVEIIGQIASALDEAHEEGFVHRDIKPANILLEEDSNRAYLSDFGIAKSLEATQSLTATGHGVGTIKYVAPEQIKNQALDRRADVYSLGCVLFEALTGSLPFDDGSDASILYAKVNDETRAPSDLDPTLRPFDRAVGRALALDPDDRFASAGDLAAAARSGLDGVDESPATTIAEPEATIPIPVLPPPARPAAARTRTRARPLSAPDRTRRLRLAIGGAVAVCVLIVVGLLISSGDDGSDGGRSAASIGATGVTGKAASEEPAPAAESTAPAPLETVPVSRELFDAEIPEGWVEESVDELNAGRFTNTWVSPDEDGVSVLIDSQATGEEEPAAIDSAASVRDQTARTSGYSEMAFEETELNGEPAAEWVFDLSGERRVDYFVYQCGVGIAVLGSAPKDAFATYEDTFRNVAESTIVPCEDTGESPGLGEEKSNGKAKGKDKKDKKSKDEDDEGDD